MDLLQSLRTRGLSIRIDGQNLIVNPRDLLTDELRDAIRADKAELLRLPDALFDAINRCCAVRGDDDANRAALILESIALPAWEQRELRDHFNEEAERWLRATGQI
ncbi:MAG: hypothetical protein V4569_17745 [Pseudomonadota bacterium]